jgi:acyl transferase domain-containing protein
MKATNSILVPWDNGRLRVPKRLTAWPKNRKERISVNNFGIGGSNAHVRKLNSTRIINESLTIFQVILDSSSSFIPTALVEGGVKESHPLLLVVSAKSQEALLCREQSLLKYMGLHPNRAGDLAYTLGARREHLSHRGFLINTDGIAPETGVIKYSVAGRAPNLTYVFTGQGAQWAGMGRGLMKSFKSFSDDIRSLDIVLQNLKRPPSWSLEGNLSWPIVFHVFNNRLQNVTNSRTFRGRC